MADRKQMTDKELLAVIASYARAALGSPTAAGPSVAGQINPAGQQMTTLEIDRYNALNAYYARPLGNEIQDRSAVVFPELRDTVEWIMPQLMRMFVSGKVCQFEATGQQDEQQADIESEVVSQIFLRENDGFFVLHDMFKDALLLRNGYANVYVRKETKTVVESYTGLSEMQLTQLLTPSDDPDDGEEIEVLEQEQHTVILPMPPGSAPPGMGAPPPLQTAYDVKIRRTTTKNRVVVECTPPEEMLVSAQARSNRLDDVQFIEHHTDQLTRSDLREMGFDEAKVDEIAVANPTWLNLIALARDEIVDQLAAEDSAAVDKAAQQVTVRTVFVRADYDGDGLTELRRVVIGGEQILENEEAEEQTFVSCAPIRMPHRHTGISYYDLLFDLQVIKTTLWRNGLDNLYLANNIRTAVDAARVNVADLLITRPGGIVRTQGAPAESIMPMVAPTNVMEQIMPAMGYLDEQRTMRTGVGKDTMGLDADALQDVTKGGQLAAMSAASLKIELVARLLAEGVKDMFLKIHRALIRNQDTPMTLKINGAWQEVDPRNWRDRNSVTVNVGLGSGTNDEKRQNLMLLAGAQEKLAQAMGTPFYPGAWETFKMVCHVLGFENPEKFGLDPHSPEYQQAMQQRAQQPQDPRAAAAQIQLQIADKRLQGEQLHVQADQQRDATQQKTEQMRAAAELQNNQDDRSNEMALALVKVIGQIVASQLKQDPAANAGVVLSQDVQAAQQAGL